MKRFSIALFICALGTFSSGRASAHDFWIEPSTFHPAPGQIVSASLRVGQKVKGDPLPNIPTLIDRFVLKGAKGETPMVGRAGADPAGAVLVSEAGEAWIGYQSHPYPVTLEGAKFDDYLREEGLEVIVNERAKNGQSATQGRERFYRCAKALLSTPEAVHPKTGVFDSPLGFSLEIVPRKDPYAMKPGGELPLALTFRGKPAANILVVAMNRDEPDARVSVRTDAKGSAKLRLQRAGFWLVKAVHMEAAPKDAGVDWESWWASITFDLPGGLRK